MIVLLQEFGTPVRWQCSVCGDEGVINNWEDSPFDLRLRRLTVVGAVSEIVIPDEVTAALRERHLLGTDCEQLVFGIRVREDGRVVLAATDGDLDALIDSLAADANHETSRRRQRRLDAAFDALNAASRTLKSG